MKQTLSEQLRVITGSLPGLRPEIFLAMVFLALIITDLLFVQSKRQERRAVVLFTVTLLSWLGAAGLVGATWPTADTILMGALRLDPLAVFFKLLFLIAGIGILLHHQSIRKFTPSPPGEFYALLTAMLFGLFLMVMSTNLLLVYLSLEIVSLCSYILTAIDDNPKSAEGGLKYLIFGALSSGVMLYGFSLLYGFTGTLDFTTAAFIRQLALIPAFPLLMACALVLSGFFFKISAFPFHFWTPDAYESAPTPVVAFFSVAPKAAAFVLLLRLVPALPTALQPALAVLALLSMTLGNFSALRQTNTKRLLAYSSIAHAGFALVGLVAQNQFGTHSLVFYLSAFVAINLLAFLLLDLGAYLSGDTRQTDRYQLDRLRGLGLQHPWLGVVTVLVMIALTGLPPTAGFTAKLFVFSALWEAYQQHESPALLYLLVLGVLNAAVALFYYLKIPFLMFFRPAPPTAVNRIELTAPQKLFMLILSIPILWFFFKADWLMKIIAGL